MDKVIFTGPDTRVDLPTLLEGYFFGLGEVCHELFGTEGEDALSLSIGHFFLEYLKRMGILEMESQDPWERYRTLIELVTRHGFYSYVETGRLEKGRYWMRETDQYAGDVWEEQGAWDRGSLPCPVWSLIQAGLSEIGWTIVLDEVEYDESARGLESIFHFERTTPGRGTILELTQRRILSSMLVLCRGCKRMRGPRGEWMSMEEYLHPETDTLLSRGLCPDCAASRNWDVQEM